MIKIQIGSTERDLNKASEGWIREQIERRRQDGQPVCVRVIIEQGALNMSLSTSGCPPSNRPSRAPKPEERKVFDFWEKSGLNKPDFQVRSLIVFLKQVSR